MSSFAALGYSAEDDGCEALVQRILLETLLDRTGCGGYGKAFGELHPSVTDLASLVCHACGNLRAFVKHHSGAGSRVAGGSEGSVEALLLESLPYFTDEHGALIRKWIASQLGNDRSRMRRSAQGLRLRRPHAAREWSSSTTGLVEMRLNRVGAPEEISRGATPSPLAAPPGLGAPSTDAGSQRPGAHAASKDFVEPPTCMASAWGHYMDSSGTLLKADGYGAIRWRGQSVSSAASPAIDNGDLVWGPCEDRYAFQCAESFVSEVSGEQYQLHRVEVFSRLPDVRCEGLSCVTGGDDEEVTMMLTAGLQLQDILYDPTRQHRTAIGLEISREAAEVPAGVFAAEGAVRVRLGVFCRVGERGNRLLMQREPPSVAAWAGRDVVRYLFPPDAMLLDPSEGPVSVTVEFVWSSSFKSPSLALGAPTYTGAIVASLPVTLVCQEVLLMMRATS